MIVAVRRIKIRVALCYKTIHMLVYTEFIVVRLWRKLLASRNTLEHYAEVKVTKYLLKYAN